MSERSQRFGLRPRVTRVAWGWRLEAGLALVVLVSLRLSLLIGPGGPVLVLGLGTLVAWRVARLRRHLARRLTDAARRRRVTRALALAGVVGPGGFAAVGRSVATPSGYRIGVRVPCGTHAGILEDAAPAIAATLQVREVRVLRVRADASLAICHVLREDPFAGARQSWPWAQLPRTSLSRPVPLGVDEDGQGVSVTLPEHHLFVGGEPGGGKSAALSLFVAAAALDPTVSISLFDAKQVELAPWAKSAAAFLGPDVGCAADALDALRSDMDARYGRLLAEGRRKLAPDGADGLHLVAIDELAFFLRAGTTKDRARFTEGLRDLVARGRAAGVIVVAATQKPSHDVVPTSVRDLFSFRLAFRCTTPEASDTILGQGWASQGCSAATIDPSTRGVGYLLAEGGVPVRCRSYYLDDEAFFVLARRAAALRGAT